MVRTIVLLNLNAACASASSHFRLISVKYGNSNNLLCTSKDESVRVSMDSSSCLLGNRVFEGCRHTRAHMINRVEIELMLER